MKSDVPIDAVRGGYSTGAVPALLGISHGTAAKAGQTVVRQLIDDVDRAVCETYSGRQICAPAVHLGHVDVQQPDVDTTLSLLPGTQGAGVVVPLLLSAGFHVKTDLVQAVEESQQDVAIAPALGPDDRLLGLLAQRLAEAGADVDRDVVILAAAGSSDTAAVQACRETAAGLGRLLEADVTPAFLSSAHPDVEQTIRAARLRHPHRRVVVASYLLAPGYFHTLLSAAGADITTEPLLAAGRPSAPGPLVDLVVDRYRKGAAELARSPAATI